MKLLRYFYYIFVLLDVCNLMHLHNNYINVSINRKDVKNDIWRLHVIGLTVISFFKKVYCFQVFDERHDDILKLI